MPVFDCSGQMAHFRDSRTLTSGIGHGKLLLLTTLTDDAPMGFIFDTSQVTGTTLHYDTLGTSVYAISVGRFVTASTSGISQILDNKSQISVYPNPTSAILNIECLTANESSSLQIIDMLGNVVKQMPFNTQHLIVNTCDLNEGVYTISVINSLGVLTKKVIVVR
jgi:hypothetical protein